MSHFDKAIIDVLKHEGGYVNNRQDPGGETKFGICKRTYPKVDIKNLTQAEAVEIYRRDFWQKRYDEMPYEVAAKTFDMAVNMGIGQAHKLLQRAVGVIDDGLIGSKTIAAINAMGIGAVLDNITIMQTRFYNNIVHNRPTSSIFMSGWLKRAEWHPIA